MKVINLMKHDCKISLVGTTMTFPPSGKIATVKEHSTEVAHRFLEKDENGHEGLQVPIVKREFGEVTNLPDPEAGKIYIVPSLVLLAVPDRKDVFAPDSGETAIRNEKGHVLSVCRLVGN